MVYEFKFPDVGEGITEGHIVKLRVKEGSIIKKDQVIAEIETDKAVAEIPSPVQGKILKINFKEGETIKVGEVLITIDDGSGSSSEKKEEIRKTEQKQEVKFPEIKKERKSFGVVGELEEASDVKKGIEIKSSIDINIPKIKATLFIRKLAQTLNVDLSKIKGTGVNGLIIEDDVKKAAQIGVKETNVKKEEVKQENKDIVSGIRAVKKYDFYGYIEHVPLKSIRKVIAEHMREAVDKAAHVTHMDEADITKLNELREKEKINAEKKGIKLTFMPYIVKACIESLKKHPYLNASLDDENKEIILKKYYNIGIAVDTENGLIVPVIKQADNKTINDISKEIFDLADKARERKLDLADLKGGTFTITNVGSIGGLYATPIVNYPEVAILGLGRMYDKPVVINGKIEIRKVLPFSLSFDHRVLDGAEAARFANDMKKVLEEAKF